MKKILLSLLLLTIILPSTFLRAEVTTGNNATGGVTTGNNTVKVEKKYTPLQNPLQTKSIKGVIFLAIDIAIYLGTAFAILAIIYAGFKMIMAQGKSEEIKEAREWLLYIVIGFAILLSAKVIVEIIRNTLVDSGVVNERLLR